MAMETARLRTRFDGHPRLKTTRLHSLLKGQRRRASSLPLELLLVLEQQVKAEAHVLQAWAVERLGLLEPHSLGNMVAYQAFLMIDLAVLQQGALVCFLALSPKHFTTFRLLV
jgi:hypothetical protein